MKVSSEGLYCDPVFIINIFMSQNSHNSGRWEDLIYDEIIRRIEKIFNKKKRKRLIKTAESYLIDEMPAILLFFSSHSFLANKRVRGWFANPMNMHPLRFVYFTY
ncbi:MAG: hypothetical protein LBQ23_01325 [Puniceicoccales bacterium]|jgi:ABC-type transport system substrate-binding protein|nr:hypothetical protein [Puniceicoccales bacterium]